MIFQGGAAISGLGGFQGCRGHVNSFEMRQRSLVVLHLHRQDWRSIKFLAFITTTVTQHYLTIITTTPFTYSVHPAPLLHLEGNARNANPITVAPHRHHHHQPPTTHSPREHLYPKSEHNSLPQTGLPPRPFRRYYRWNLGRIHEQEKEQQEEHTITTHAAAICFFSHRLAGRPRCRRPPSASVNDHQPANQPTPNSGKPVPAPK